MLLHSQSLLGPVLLSIFSENIGCIRWPPDPSGILNSHLDYENAYLVPVWCSYFVLLGGLYIFAHAFVVKLPMWRPTMLTRLLVYYSIYWCYLGCKLLFFTKFVADISRNGLPPRIHGNSLVRMLTLKYINILQIDVCWGIHHTNHATGDKQNKKVLFVEQRRRHASRPWT